MFLKYDLIWNQTNHFFFCFSSVHLHVVLTDCKILLHFCALISTFSILSQVIDNRLCASPESKSLRVCLRCESCNNLS